MSGTILKCPVCTDGDCTHDQDDRQALWRELRPGEPPEVEAAAPYSAADHQQVGKREAKKRRRDHQEREDFRWLMRQPQFRRFAVGLIETCGVNKSSFSTDALTMAFAEGQRNVGLQVFAMITSSPEYSLMLKEQQDAAA